MEAREELDCSFTQEITCPYCGHAQMDSWESSDESDDEECSECGKHYRYTSETTRSFSSYQVPCLNGEPHLFSEWREVLTGVTSRYCRHCSKRETKREAVEAEA